MIGRWGFPFRLAGVLVLVAATSQLAAAAPIDAATFERYRRGADAGVPFMLYNVGYCYDYGNGVAADPQKALAYYLAAAKTNYVHAEIALAELYQHGRGVPVDYVEALKWYHRAADAGDTWGMESIGLAYDRGQGVPQDFKLAMVWLMKAVNAGRPGANVNVGQMYEHGHGVEVDLVEAFNWYRRGAEAGSPIAMGNLFVCYSTGRGTPRNPKLAQQWLERAQAAGDPTAGKWLAEHWWRKYLMPTDRSILVMMIGSVATMLGTRMLSRGESPERRKPRLQAALAGISLVMAGICYAMYGLWSVVTQV